MRKLFALLAIAAASAVANEISVHTLQSGDPSGPTPIHDHGIHGEGQVIAVLDTGLDYDHCQFAEADGSPPPINTGTPQSGLASANVNAARRKVIAYDFLYSCDQFPSAFGCDNSALPTAYDNQGHGTVTASAAAGDAGAFVIHDLYDSIAPAAKLVIQDTGYIGGDNCTQRAGLGCPVIDLHPVLQQAYDQGARIHSNSWGDLQGLPSSPPPTNPPTANYSAAARDIDDFVWTHPDMVVVFNTGNAGLRGESSLSAPGDAKNTIQVGGTRVGSPYGVGPPEYLDDTLVDFSGTGPTRDGRIKPDLVGPAYVRSALPDGNVTTRNCDTSWQPGTSLASPTVAGAAALVRQYYADGFYPGGRARSADRFNPSASLVKATLIAAARAVPYHASGVSSRGLAAPPPSYQQGWGFPVLGDVLAFGPSRLEVRDVASASGLGSGESFSTSLAVRAGAPLKIVLVWTDPAGVPRNVSDFTPELVNDLDLRVVDPSGAVLLGNESLHPGQADRLNNVEVVSIATPISGTYSVSISAASLGRGPRQSYSLVMSGDFTPAVAKAKQRAARHR
jgi:hypothetical protein